MRFYLKKKDVKEKEKTVHFSKDLEKKQTIQNNTVNVQKTYPKLTEIMQQIFKKVPKIHGK